MEKEIVKKLREVNGCHNCRKHRDDSGCDTGSVICTLDGVEEKGYMICNHYDSPKEYKIRGHNSLQDELNKIQNQLNDKDDYERT